MHPKLHGFFFCTRSATGIVLLAIEASDIARVMAAVQAGDPVGAERDCRGLLLAQPDNETALVLLAIALQHQHLPLRAAAIHERLTVLYPANATHWSNLATLLREVGRLDEAEEAYHIALRLTPDDAGIQGNLGLLYKERGDYVGARRCLLLAARALPEDHEFCIYAAVACFTCGDNTQAAALVAPWREWLPLGAALSVDLAWLFTQTGRVADAARLLDDSLRLDGARPRTIARMVGLLERINRLREAAELLATLPAPETFTDPADRLEVVNAMSVMALRGPDPAMARALLERLIGVTHDTDQLGNLNFALAKASDKQGDTVAAMHALRVAHAAQVQKAAQLVPELMQAEIPSLAPALNRMTPEQVASYPPAGPADSSPIFVVGFPRSGTTMLEQMLDAHPALRSMDEQPFLLNVCEQVVHQGVLYPEALGTLSSATCTALRQSYWDNVATVVSLQAGQRLVDKNPLNLLHLPLICRLFPEAPIILALRHPCDVILSCYMQNFSAPAFQVLCSSLPRLAGGYVNAMDFWIYHEALFKPRVLHLRYEDLLDNFKGEASRIAAFVGVADSSALRRFDQHARAKGFISTPSYAQVAQPPNKSAIDRWRRYETEFTPLLPLLQNVMEHWGYAS